MYGCDEITMRIKNEIFNGKMLCAIGAICAVLSPAFAATNNGCDKEGNGRINPEIALCSTHVYNIGEDSNPATEADKQLMRNVVALKSTIMTQQMYKQYEYLETMIRRFKTQLEKAVLTTKLQVAGADTSVTGSSSYSGVGTSTGGGSSYRSRDSYIVVDGAKDCNMESGGTLAVLQCVQNNINSALAVLDANQVADAKRQLEKDFDVAVKNGGAYNTSGLKRNSEPVSCTRMSNNAASVRNCAYDLLSAMRLAIDNYNRQNRTYNKSEY